MEPISLLLFEDEGEMLKSAVHTSKQALSTAIVQLYTFDRFSSRTWQLITAGALYLMNDNDKSFFFEIYSLQDGNLEWQFKIYRNFEYIKEKPFFHMFESDNEILGFNFTCEEEADLFYYSVHNFILTKSKFKWLRNIFRKNKCKTRRPNLKIGSPYGFKHLAHVGLHSSFDENENDNENTFSKIREMAELTVHNVDDDPRKKLSRCLNNHFHGDTNTNKIDLRKTKSEENIYENYDLDLEEDTDSFNSSEFMEEVYSNFKFSQNCLSSEATTS